MSNRMIWRAAAALSRCAALCLVLLFPARVTAFPGDENWEGLSFQLPYTYGQVWSMAAFKGELYAAGWFWKAGDVSTTNLARWNGTNWSPFLPDDDVSSSSVRVMAASDERLFLADFLRLQSWDGTNYSAVPDAPLFINAIATSGTNLYVGGFFTNVGAVAANSIARWNGTEWHPLGIGTDGAVSQIATRGGEVFAAGTFTSAGGVSASNIARWDGTNWTPLGDGLGVASGLVSISALHATAAGVFVAGYFTRAGAQNITNLARWDGTNWHPVGGHNQFGIEKLYSLGETLYVSGRFTSLGGVAVTNFARWHASNWSPGGISGGEAQVYAMMAHNGSFYVGGSFSRAGDLRVNSIACWDGAQWSALDDGITLPGGFRAMAVLGTNFYTAGSFFEIGGISASNIAKWDGNAWSSLALGADDEVNAMVVLSNRLYVGGAFFNVNGAAARHVARWNGTRWSALGSGVDFPVLAMTVFKGDVVAGGSGSGSSIPVARWNGARWIGLARAGHPVPFKSVSALAANSTHLFAIVADSVVGWNGTNWFGLGSYGGGVRAIATYRGRLFAAGSFYEGTLAEWTGDKWVYFAPLDFSVITSLAVMNDDFYVTSYGFPSSPGQRPGDRTSGIARWDGLEWSYLGSGVNASALGLLKHGDDMYVSGWFREAGSKPATFIAIWHDPPPKPELRTSQPSDSIVVSWPNALTNYILQRNSALRGSTWTEVQAMPSTVGSRRVITNSTGAAARFYRLKKR